MRWMDGNVCLQRKGSLCEWRWLLTHAILFYYLYFSPPLMWERRRWCGRRQAEYGLTDIDGDRVCLYVILYGVDRDMLLDRDWAW